MIKIKLIKKSKGNITTSAGTGGGGITFAEGGSSSGGNSDYAKESDHAQVAEYAKESGHAKEADHAQKAYTLDELSPVLEWFLSKVKNDRTPFDLTVGGRLKAEDWTHFGDFLSGLEKGFGGGVDSKGNAEFQSIRVRSFMEVAELIFNRLAAIQGDQLFTEGDTIEECILNTDGSYTLKLKEEWDGYFTAQYENNVIKGIFNNISNSISGEGTTKVNGATYYTSWMRIVSLDIPNNTLRVVLYPDDETPAGKNFPPCEMMKIARWGNSGATTDENGARTEYGRRQSCFEISSSEGRIIQYINVTKPIVDASNVALCIGRCPEFLDGVNQDIHTGDIVIYIQKVLAEQIIKVKWQGAPTPTILYRGEWNADQYYYDGSKYTDENGEPRYNELGGYLYERSQVSYWGCLWVCNKTGTKNPPSWLGTDWTLQVGVDNMVLEFDSNETAVWIDSPQLRIGVICRISTQDMTDDPSITYSWTRQSWHSGVEDTASDKLWNDSHVNFGREVNLVEDDMNYSFGRPPEKLIYTCTATLLDASGNPAKNSNNNVITDSISYNV